MATSDLIKQQQIEGSTCRFVSYAEDVTSLREWTSPTCKDALYKYLSVSNTWFANLQPGRKAPRLPATGSVRDLDQSYSRFVRNEAEGGGGW